MLNHNKDDITGVEQKPGHEIIKVEKRLTSRIGWIGRDVTALKWMVGATLAGIVSIIIRIFLRCNAMFGNPLSIAAAGCQDLYL